jgi:hypothetical protein
MFHGMSDRDAGDVIEAVRKVLNFYSGVEVSGGSGDRDEPRQ